ncbi:MAG: carboxypeptidase regulatory-like domain-containing protein, partial [Candidatus Lokiarchaeia archaeon]|nr:carboxypeptidase regulatory-like domain-containing protein [Candidatus Lokiarchaeia archaeon]
MIFNNPCGTKNVNETSVRVCCWNGKEWFELDSQIYDLSFIDSNHLQECSLIFLVPEIANGNEKYYVYYDDNEKPAPNYLDHLSIEDSTYSFSPISSISVEANYFGIKEDDFYVYCVGQEGNLLNREFSQIVVKQKKDREKIDVLDSDQIVSLAFSYYYGDKESDERSSDQIFVSKEILIDGNLMVEFGIKSESKRRDIRTTIFYRYYYNPLDEKRLSVRVKHEMLESVVVKGKVNIDGRFGMMASFKSRSPTIDKLNVGDIYPYLHFFGENDQVNDYQMNVEPESKKREWVVSYNDDADLGKEAWIAYGNGQKGKSNSIIFSSNKDVIKSGVDERDGIQIKVAEKEYFDFLSAEVDYASINFGRNSFEKGYSHDIRIPEDLVVMFDAELFSSYEGGYEAVRKEAKIYQQLVKHRYISEDSTFEKEQKKHELTVFTYLGGTRFSYPRLSNITDNFFPTIWIELTQEGKQIISGETNKPLFFRYRSYINFPEVIEGNYLIKVFWKFGNSNKFFTGAKTVTINKNTRVHIFCSWERPIHVSFIDQFGNVIQGIKAVLLNNDGVIFDENTSDDAGSVVLKTPFTPGNSYVLQAFYKGLMVHEDQIRNSVIQLKLELDLKLYDLTVIVEDKFNLPPGIEITPMLSKTSNKDVIQLNPIEINRGQYFFEKIPSGDYKIQVVYANFIDEKFFNIPDNGDTVIMKFSAAFDINIDLFDIQANPLLDTDINFKVYRYGNKILQSDEKKLSLAPAYYIINA